MGILFQKSRLFLLHRSPLVIGLMGLGLLALVGLADAHLFENISFALFYLIPVIFTAWFAGRFPGCGMTLLATGVLLINNISANSYKLHWLVPVWNALASGMVFLLAVFLLAFLKRQMEMEKTRALLDPLTDILNRRGFYAELKSEVLRSRRYRHAFSLALLDVDDFKGINDSWGHQRGDEVLQAIAHALKASVRATDGTARLGGDEFALLLPETDNPSARIAIERLRKHLTDFIPLQVTFSIGCTSFISPEQTIDDIINRADMLMYRAKKAGKNRVVYDDVTVVDFQSAKTAEALRMGAP